MDKLKGFILFDGILVGGGLIFFLYLILNRKSPNQFKEDLWEEVKVSDHHSQGFSEFVNQKGERVRVDDRIDQRLLLEAPEETSRAEQTSSSPAKHADKNVAPPFAFPNFRGKAHEILGIPLGASAETVVQAHRYWIKRYHPDRVTRISPEAVNQAKVRSEQLNRARADLLRVASK